MRVGLPAAARHAPGRPEALSGWRPPRVVVGATGWGEMPKRNSEICAPFCDALKPNKREYKMSQGST